MIDYDPREPLIFLHIPKTAGSSVRAIFKAWYGNGWFDHYFDLKEGGRPPKHDLFEMAPLSTRSTIFGHFNRARQLGVQDYYPNATQFITIMRDPFEQMLSAYFFLRRWRDVFEAHREVPGDDIVQHIQTYRSNILDFFPCAITPDNYEAVIESQFVEIGLTEHLEQSMTRIASKLGFIFTPDMLGHENSTVRDKSVDKVLRDQFRERHALEYTVYDFIAAKYA